jgi:hypothetical protein
MNNHNLFIPIVVLCISLIIGLSCCAAYAQDKNILTSGEPIKAGGEKGIAPIFSYGSPQGAAFIRNREYPDIFAKNRIGVESPSELYRYEYRYTTEDGHLVYSSANLVDHPWKDSSVPTEGRIFNHNSDVLGVWLSSDEKISMAKYEEETDSFIKVGDIRLLDEYDRVEGIEVRDIGDNKLEIILLRDDGKGQGAPQNEERTLSLYDGAGSYRGKLSKSGLYSFEINIKTMKQVSELKQNTPGDDVIISGSRVIRVGSKNENLNGFVVTNTIGALKYVPLKEESNAPPEVKYVFKNEEEVLYQPAQGARGIPFGPDRNHQNEIVISGERTLYHFRYSGTMTNNGEPVYSEPKKILQENADLYAGSLTVPNVADWNGDGALDIVSGNSEGRLLFFKNNGTNKLPEFAFPEEVKSAGKSILFRPGYNIIQGPMEAAWGYLCPTVFDWNNDGLLDVVFSGSRAKFEVMINRGTKTKPKLEAPVPLRMDYMELPGTWRVKPAIAKINGRNAIVILDTEDEVHLYWRAGNYSVKDGGELRMEDGTKITHRSTEKQLLGQRGRAKFQLVDWDDDGALDLIIGTSKRSAFPNPERGMPFARYEKGELGLQVIFMRNVGTNENMKFTDPVQFQLNGKDLYLGTHTHGPYATELGDTSNGLNMVVGVESGKFYFFNRKDLTTIGFDQIK